MKKNILLGLLLMLGLQLFAQNRNYGKIDSTHTQGTAPMRSTGKTKLVKAGTETEEEDSTYISTVWKFSITVPSHWDFIETKSTQSNVPIRILSPLNFETVDIYKSDVKDNFRENVSVETMNIGEDSLSSFYNITFSNFKGYYDGFLEQEKGITKNGACKWFIFKFIGNGELPMKAFVGCYVGENGVGYKVIAIAEERKFDQYYEEFKKVITSFKYIK